MSAAKQSVAAMWAEFERKVIPQDASLRQRQEMKLAFYAGALVLFNVSQDLDPCDEVTDADHAHFDRLYNEINDFLINEVARRTDVAGSA